MLHQKKHDSIGFNAGRIGRTSISALENMARRIQKEARPLPIGPTLGEEGMEGCPCFYQTLVVYLYYCTPTACEQTRTM